MLCTSPPHWCATHPLALSNDDPGRIDSFRKQPLGDIADGGQSISQREPRFSCVQ